MLPIMLMEPTGVAGGGVGVTDPPAAVVVTAPPDPSEGFKAALKKHGDDANSLARESWTNAERYRLEADGLRGKVPKDGTVTLDGTELDEWNAFRKLGKFADVKATLDTLPTLEGKVKGHEREKLLGAAAKAHGFDAEVLATLAGPDLHIEVKDGKDKAGKAIKVAEVVTKTKDDKGVEVEKREPLDKFAEAMWAKFLPSLKGTAAAAAQGTPTNRQVVGTPVTTAASRHSVTLPRI
jgi:hypothetical protein